MSHKPNTQPSPHGPIRRSSYGPMKKEREKKNKKRKKEKKRERTANQRDQREEKIKRKRVEKKLGDLAPNYGFV